MVPEREERNEQQTVKELISMPEKILWFEVWIDTSTVTDEDPYLLLLRAYADGSFETLDPQRDYALDKKFASYEDATFDLTEDEYTRIEGREKID